MVNKKPLSCKRIRAQYHYLSTTYYIIPTYAFPLTAESRQRLLRIIHPVLHCNSEVMFKHILLAPGSHPSRFALPLRYILLSSSTSFHILCYYKKKPLISQGFLFINSYVILEQWTPSCIAIRNSVAGTTSAFRTTSTFRTASTAGTTS